MEGKLCGVSQVYKDNGVWRRRAACRAWRRCCVSPNCCKKPIFRCLHVQKMLLKPDKHRHNAHRCDRHMAKLKKKQQQQKGLKIRKSQQNVERKACEVQNSGGMLVCMEVLDRRVKTVGFADVWAFSLIETKNKCLVSAVTVEKKNC